MKAAIEELTLNFDQVSRQAAAMEREVLQLRTLNTWYGYSSLVGWLVAFAFACGMLWQSLRLEGVL